MNKAAPHFLVRWIRAICLCSAFLAPIAAAEYVELIAEIELTNWSYWFIEDRAGNASEPANNPQSIFHEPLKVRCVIGTNSWLMEGPFMRNATVTRWFTGSNLIEQTLVTAEASLRDAARNLKLQSSAPLVGHEYTREHETADGNPGRPVRVEDLFPDATGKVCWLAFCSGPALKREGRRIPLPGALWKQFFSGQRFSDKTEVFADSLAFPQSIQLWETDQQLLLNYQVRSSTNVLGWNIPLEFYPLQYNRASSPGTNSLELHLAAKGRVTGIGPGSEPAIPKE